MRRSSVENSVVMLFILVYQKTHPFAGRGPRVLELRGWASTINGTKTYAKPSACNSVTGTSS
jgi:hypothetical protein